MVRRTPLRWGIFAAAALFAAAAASVPARAKPFDVESFTLANGLQVVVVPNHRAPIVSLMVWYKAGAADEPRGTSGIAHFVEHLMFKGTKDVAPGEFARTVAMNGGRDNAFTTHDYTGFYENVAADRLPLVMKLEADRMTGLVLSDKVVLPEREVIIEERRTRIDNAPEALLDEQIDTALFLNDQYRLPTIGWEHEMHRLTTQDALAFYHTWYAPNNAVLVVAGDVKTEDVRLLADKFFGPLERHDVPVRVRLEEPPRAASARLTMMSARVGAVRWSRSYLAPSYQAGDTGEAYPLQVLSEALGSSASSILYRHLVLEKGIALSVGTDYSAGMLGPSSFSFFAMPKKDVAVPAFEAALDQEIQAVLKDGLSAADVESAKKRLKAQIEYATDSLGGPARIVGAALATGRSLADVEAWPDRIGAVTAAEVNDAARKVLRDDVAVTGVLLPDPHAGPAPVAAVRPPSGETVQ